MVKPTTKTQKARSSIKTKTELDTINWVNFQADNVISSLLEELAPEFDNIDIMIENITRLQKKCQQLGDKEVDKGLADEVASEVKSYTTEIQNIIWTHKKVTGSNINHLGNTINKCFLPNLDGTLDMMGIDPGRFMEPKPEKQHVMNRMIFEHFLREGLLEVAECFKNEAVADNAMNDYYDPTIIEIMKKVYSAFDAFKNQDEKPAMALISENFNRFQDASSPLPFMVYKVAFMQLVKSGKNLEAIKFARVHLKPYADKHSEEMQHLMGTMLFTPGKGLHHLEANYAAYFNKGIWEDGLKIFIQEALYSLGASRLSPFPTIFEVGVQALSETASNPELHQFLRSNWEQLQAANAEDKKNSQYECSCTCSVCLTGECQKTSEKDKQWGPNMCQDPALVFHTVFVCPVTREEVRHGECTRIIGWQYPCGHVISKEAFIEIQNRSDHDVFKCPICSQSYFAVRSWANGAILCPVRAVFFAS